jgi:alanyl-tRNA synthetase
MMSLNRKTKKLYYERPYLVASSAKVTRVYEDGVELDQTVAYPEGGGQESDQGVITTLSTGLRLRFVHAKKMYGVSCTLEEFPDVKVDGVVWHVVHADDRHLLPQLREGVQVSVVVDAERRARLSLSHTASHLLYLAVGEHRPDALAGVIGCHIKSEGARFDFCVTSRFTPEDVAAIEQTANSLVDRKCAVTLEGHPNVPDARYWHCDGKTIPCGGTHIDNTAAIGRMRIKRKCLGSGKERLSCEFSEALPDLARYSERDISLEGGHDK